MFQLFNLDLVGGPVTLTCAVQGSDLYFHFQCQHNK